MTPIMQGPLLHTNDISHSTTKKEEEEDSYEEFSQKYMYTFDDPLIQDSAFVHVFNNKIIAQFPVKPDYTQDFQSMHHNQLYLNRQLIFHTNWLPILTSQDYTKFKAIFHQLWHEYTILTRHKYYSASAYVPYMYSELMTIYNTPSYYLSCIESVSLTSIDLTTKLTHLFTPQTIPIHVQFYIGSHLILCSETQLSHLEGETLQFVLAFILLKLMN